MPRLRQGPEPLGFAPPNGTGSQAGSRTDSRTGQSVGPVGPMVGPTVGPVRPFRTDFPVRPAGPTGAGRKQGAISAPLCPRRAP